MGDGGQPSLNTVVYRSYILLGVGGGGDVGGGGADLCKAILPHPSPRLQQ